MNASPLLLSDHGNSPYLPIQITQRAPALSRDTVVSIQVSPRWVDVLERTSQGVRFGALKPIEIRVPASVADNWELLDKEIVQVEELFREPEGAKRYRLLFLRPGLDKLSCRFHYRLLLDPPLDAGKPREVTVPWISFPDKATGSTRVELSLAPEVVLVAPDQAWVSASEDSRAEFALEGPLLEFAAREPAKAAQAIALTVRALEAVPLPPIVVPRLLVQTVQGEGDVTRSRASYLVESHGPDFAFALADGTRWISARIDGRIAEQVEHDPSRSSYRLRFPGDLEARPVLVELEYESSARRGVSAWRAPRLLDGGVVLGALWEVRLPSRLAIFGAPPGWTDENQWYWDGYMWKQRSWKNVAALREWLVGTAASPLAIGDFDGGSSGSSDHYLFSHAGEPSALQLRVVAWSWLVAICSGATLVVGFFVIFSKVRWRTIWLAIAAIGLLAAALLQPAVMVLVFQSALFGCALTLLGLLMERLIERRPAMPSRDSSLVTSRAGVDSSLQGPVGVGSDDSTAIRVRVPSTVDFVPAPLVADEAASASVERA
jgi:hypothetical protein